MYFSTASAKPSSSFEPVTKRACFFTSSLALPMPMDEIAVIGDGGNDVAMFQQSGLSIAMGNASDEVKKHARFVTGSNDEDGFADAVEKYVLGAAR